MGTQRLEPEAPEVQGGPQEMLGPAVRGLGHCLQAGSPTRRRPRRGPVHTAWRGAKTTPGPLCWTRRQSEGPVHHPRVGPPPSACGRTKPSLKAAEPDGTFLGGKGWGRGRWRAGGSRPPAWSPELRQARDGYLGTRSGAVPGSPSCRPGSTCRFFLVSGGRRRSYKQREHGVGGPSVLW